ncbi:hypothetical protein V8C86DRAFT_463946 [Haematococcus lacustris]
MDTVTVRSLLQDRVLLKPHLLGSNLVDVVTHSLRASLEGVCSSHGYIVPGSLKIHSLAPGVLMGVSLNGDVSFSVRFYADVCDPPVGMVLRGARVVKANRFGVMAHVGIDRPTGEMLPVLEIIMTKQAIAGREQDPEVDLDGLQPGDVVSVEVLAREYELGDARIAVIGRALGATAAAKAEGTHKHLDLREPLRQAVATASRAAFGGLLTPTPLIAVDDGGGWGDGSSQRGGDSDNESEEADDEGEGEGEGGRDIEGVGRHEEDLDDPLTVAKCSVLRAAPITDNHLFPTA